MTNGDKPLTSEQKMDEILFHLKRLDHRDAIRMWGSFVRGLLTVIPLLFLLGSLWYLYVNKDVLIKNIGQAIGEQAGSAVQSKGTDAINNLKGLFGN